MRCYIPYNAKILIKVAQSQEYFSGILQCTENEIKNLNMQTLKFAYMQNNCPFACADEERELLLNR
jgi:hypothetical protein